MMQTTDQKVQILHILDDDKTLFEKGDKYVIPRYQRAYAWEDKEIVQLIDDINDVKDGSTYYIGSLIVAKVKGVDNTFEVVDGQQRLTTLFLLLQYLAMEGDKQLENLSFDCRENSNYTLQNIRAVIQSVQKNDNSSKEDRIELSILNGIKVINKVLKENDFDKEKFLERLKRVILFRIEVPDHTDLNRYFEIMNTRGEQLEQHDILKAKLMGYLREEERAVFAKIWNACSDMTGYVQMHFTPNPRKEIFGGDWQCLQKNSFEDLMKCFGNNSQNQETKSITDIIRPDFAVKDADGEDKDGKHIRFESIIDFPHFLLHALRVFINAKEWSNDVNVQKLLDDKKLITDFDAVLNNKYTDKSKFAKEFISHLLNLRWLFDKYIIKREFTGDNSEGEWSLKQLNKSEDKPYYKNTELKIPWERETTYKVHNPESLMIQSALRVSYTSPKVMHWITDLLIWLSDDNKHKDGIAGNLTKEAEKIAAQAVKENFFNKENFETLGVQTPHIVFNFLDYLLWKDNKDKDEYKDFVFEFRNSVEHWYPQNPSDGSFNEWEKKDMFGNLCIVSRNVNSKFSNLSPESKMMTYEEFVKKGSIKLRIMGELIQKHHNGGWIDKICQEHHNEMIQKLENKVNSLNNQLIL